MNGKQRKMGKYVHIYNAARRGLRSKSLTVSHGKRLGKGKEIQNVHCGKCKCRDVMYGGQRCGTH
jgi:hypothetical protein